MCSAFPVFLTGALGVQLRDDIGLTATHVGLSMGSSFGVAAVLSAPMGRVAERLGPRRGFRVGLTTSALAMLAVALLARNVWQFCLLLGVAGAGNALNQPSANLMLATHIEGERLGFALAAKQSGMPAAARRRRGASYRADRRLAMGLRGWNRGGSWSDAQLSTRSPQPI